jgi:hypothetical protein
MSDQTDDEVGYGKPPKATRFKKGQSGNPKGRPAGAKGVKASLKHELDSKITVREGGRDKKITKAEAIAKTVIASGLNGASSIAAYIVIAPGAFVVLHQHSPDRSRMAAAAQCDHCFFCSMARKKVVRKTGSTLDRATTIRRRNRAENSHLPFLRMERAMLRFR